MNESAREFRRCLKVSIGGLSMIVAAAAIALSIESTLHVLLKILMVSATITLSYFGGARIKDGAASLRTWFRHLVPTEPDSRG